MNKARQENSSWLLNSRNDAVEEATIYASKIRKLQQWLQNEKPFNLKENENIHFQAPHECIHSTF